jgi:lysophospholipase-2
LHPLQIPAPNLDLPVFYGHGSADPLIPAAVANATLAVLQGRGLRDVQFKMYPGMAHSSCPQELQDLKRFLETVLPARGWRSG